MKQSGDGRLLAQLPGFFAGVMRHQALDVEQLCNSVHDVVMLAFICWTLSICGVILDAMAVLAILALAQYPRGKTSVYRLLVLAQPGAHYQGRAWAQQLIAVVQRLMANVDAKMAA